MTIVETRNPLFLPSIKSFYKIHRQKQVDVCQKANSQFVQNLFNSQRNTRGIFDETDVDSYFYLNIFDISQSQHRIVRVSKGSNKKSVDTKFFQLCDLNTQQHYILQEEVNISERELSSVVDNSRKFHKAFDKASKSLQIPLPKSKVEIGSTKSKHNLFANYYNDIIEHPNRQIR